MDGDWEEVGRLLLPKPAHQVPPTSIVCAFDSSQELLWVGNEYGRVSSFYGTDFQQYASFKGGEGPIRQILFHERGAIVLGMRSVHMAMRRGPPIWHIRHDDMKELYCMSYTSKGTSEILVAGLQDQMFVINVDKGTISRQIPTKDHYRIMKRSRYICAATQKGTVNILDSVTFSVVKTWNAHASLINDMDAQHDFIVTCGYSIRPQQQSYILDPLVNVFDLKNMLSLSPIPFPAGAAFVRLHPRMSTTSIVVSQLGQIHIVDLMNVNTSNVKQANVLTYLSMIEIAPSGEAMILADAERNLHLWGSPSRIRFAEFSSPTEFADPEETVTQVPWSNETPLNSVGMPYYRELLLSAWPNHMIHEVGAPPLIQQHPALTVPNWTLSTHPSGGYALNPRTLKRNQVENTRTIEKSTPSLQVPKFLSDRQRENANNTPAEHKTDTDVIGTADLSAVKGEIPARYCNVEIKYSKFGVDDFDFGHYNKTEHSGLEIHIANSYANPLLQIMHFTPIIRNLALQHTATWCTHSPCMLCEMGFLFDMLEKANGSICQATNLLRSLSSQPEAAKKKLLEEDADEEAQSPYLTKMLQGLNRFLVGQIALDWKRTDRQPMIEQALATSATTTIRCINCRYETVQPANASVHDLCYPEPKLSVRNARAPKPSFSQVLKSSIERDHIVRGYCVGCHGYRNLATRTTIHSVPQVLVLNANLHNSTVSKTHVQRSSEYTTEVRKYWEMPGCLPEEIGVIIDRGQFFCYEGEDLKLHLQRGMHNITVYSLVGLAADIYSGPHQKRHLVSLVNVAHSMRSAPPQSRWHLFNDFLVQPVTSAEALSFNPAWKMPSVIAYQVKTANNRIDDTWKQHLDTSLLYTDTKYGLSPINLIGLTPHSTNGGERTYRPLEPSVEVPGEGTIIALDAEFVSVRQPEIAVTSEGNHETIRPTVHALARVSVIRGSGEHEQEPFIDDYIAIKEPIVDYLTSFSGIRQGDLDQKTSKHNLVTLKTAYKKLWVLLNLGCKFLGHGLKQDFRVTNIHIPKSQVIDTIDLFYDKTLGHRRISLAFLAWSLLKEEIQLETHDSIEDARTALKLYRKYLEFQDAGIFKTMLQSVYDKGKVMNWKAPAAIKNDLIQRSETPPIPMDGQQSAAVTPASGPTTPIRRPLGLAPGTGSSFSSGWTPGRGSTLGGSPLR